MKVSTLLTIVLLAFTFFSSTGNAGIIIGTPVSDTGADLGLDPEFFSGDPDGVIKYFIPLIPDTETISEVTFGVSGGGLSSDTYAAPLGGMKLNMYLYFDIADGMKGDTLTLWFDDLDLAHSNTPTGFFETITFNETNPGELGGYITDGKRYEQWSQLDGLDNVSFNNATIPPNNSNVSITISGLSIYDEFWLNLQFTSYSEGLNGTYYNTPEFLSAKLTTVEVPEPPSIVLMILSLGLLASSKYKAINKPGAR